MPKYEKVNKHTLRIIIEKADDVSLNTLLENKKALETERDRINKVLKNIDEMLVEAKRLGITPLVKEKDVEKKICPLCKGTDIPCPQCNKHLKEK